ncbi:MAG: chromosome segregation protein [Verrucomicrobiales bacterium]|nr:chromosome segregation protein [Verrucomicrobiales bacterium]
MNLFLQRLTLQNYRSIGSCSIRLAPLTFLVGPNASGKSNCLDAIRFVADALRTSLDHAIRERGSINEVRRRSGGHPVNFAIRLDFMMPDSSTGHYSFKIGAQNSGGFEIVAEELSIKPTNREALHYYRVERGNVTKTSEGILPAAYSDRLFLVAASGLPAFRPVYEALCRMDVYNLNPKEVASLQRPDPGDRLLRDGKNAASVFQNLSEPAREKVREYLPRIIPGIADAETKGLGPQETLEFRQVIQGQKHPWRFFAASMSDGTLRAFGILLALFQGVGRALHAPVIGLEEPEMALHPGASGVLMGALREASETTQIIVTSHSPELLDDPDIDPGSIFSVVNEEGNSYIAPVDEAGRELMKKRLFTAGELLRQNQLTPEPSTSGSLLVQSFFDLK